MVAGYFWSQLSVVSLLHLVDFVSNPLPTNPTNSLCSMYIAGYIRASLIMSRRNFGNDTVSYQLQNPFLHHQ